MEERRALMWAPPPCMRAVGRVVHAALRIKKGKAETPAKPPPPWSLGGPAPASASYPCAVVLPPQLGFMEDMVHLDSVCAFCDDGGEIARCQGKCLRSFHVMNDTGEGCQGLGYTRVQLDEMEGFLLCKNCEHEIYQCFACQQLGSANTSPPEVFRCASASCGHFYHAECVAQLLFPENEASATDYTARITNGENFSCPLHTCDVCNHGEIEGVKELQFAVCRRCPKSYHRRCLPREIVFDDVIQDGVFLFKRAWDEGLLPNNRVLIYCLNHDVDPELRTPPRDHIRFPDDPAI